ncbi:uncharacterized protein LOC126343024 isoform X3 [Schistocerca gregaria]|uniref:uncharacterized protein LOC126343024 isoform X3 n=1 Tax=Schistocerca gregaria TaxID=7010 RepID=UPI00211E6A95|nr:uncharacterized protein LOC126343024 isoform X3 [Schistocerca gregaria]
MWRHRGLSSEPSCESVTNKYQNNPCEDEWSEIQQRFEKEGLDFENLGPEERLLHVWRWLVDAESNLRSTRRQLDKLRDLRSEEMEEMENYIGHIRDLAEKRADHLENETITLRSKLESSQEQAATLASLLEKSGLQCIADDSLGEQVAFLIADRAKLMEEIEVLKKLGFSNDVNGVSKDGDLLSEIIKVSSEKEVLRREVNEMCDRVQLLEKASRQLELDNERLAFKLSEALAELEEREAQLKHLVNGGEQTMQSAINLLWPAFKPGDSPHPPPRRSFSLQPQGDSPKGSLKKGSSPRNSFSKMYRADSTPPSLMMSEFSCGSPKKLAGLLDSQMATSRGELMRLEEIKKLQAECENLRAQLATVTEKYNALALRHIQYKAKRKAQIDELRSRFDAELSSLQCQVENLQSQLSVQKKMLSTEESLRSRVETDYRQIQEEKRALMVNAMHLETAMREKEREITALGKKILLLENANSDLLAKVLQLKYSTVRQIPKNQSAMPKSNSVEGVLMDLGSV